MEYMKVEAGVAGVGILRGLPAIDAPMHASGREEGDAKGLIARYGTDLVVEPPAEMLARVFLNQISLNGLWRLVKDFVVVNRASELDVFRVSPDEWAG